MTLTIRAARPGEAGTILSFVEALARYEKLSDEVEATEAMIDAALFGPDPKVFAEIAEVDGDAVGFALWFYNFSTFGGRHGLYLEDLFVDPGHRGRGIGRALLRRLARRCVAEGLGRFEWSVLDWNAPSIAFYSAMGAGAMDDWTVFRVTGEALAALAGGAEEPGR
jgi:GNAT superfamily N-acetyltransferase